MTQQEFLSQLQAALRKNHIADADEILEEYAQHFTLKCADGYTPEEVAARLGNPVQLASQFGTATGTGGHRAIAAVGLGFADFGFGLLLILLGAWALVMTVLPFGFAFLAAGLLAGWDFQGVIPGMPYWCSALFGVTCLSLAALTWTGMRYYWAFLAQILRAYSRSHHNIWSAAGGGPVLPPLGLHPSWKPSLRRRLRTVALAASVLFAVSALLAMATAMLSAQNPEFWHVWGWFV